MFGNRHCITIMSRYSLFLLTLLIAGNAHAQTTLAQKEDKAINVVTTLPEIKALIKSWNDRISHIALRIAKDPDPSFKYFCVEVGVDSKYIYNTSYNFYVTPGTYKVQYLDVRSDSLLTLTQWRDKNNKGNR